LKHFRRVIEIFILLSFIVIGGLVVQGVTFSAGPEVSPPEGLMLTEARFWKEMAGDRVQCQLCFRACTIAEGSRGHCETRINKDGELYSLIYGRAAAIQIDPVEKEPLLHFLPATSTLCFGTAGCNFRCRFCQNWHLAAMKPEEVDSLFLVPEKAVEGAIMLGCQSISFTYNEPTVFYEWMYDVAEAAKAAGIRTYFHTNGGMKEKPLKELLQYMDAVCVDLKGFTAEFFEETSLSELEPVLDTLKTIKESGVWLEITCLIIPTLNDDMEKIEEMCLWIKDNLGDEVPVHFSRFFPAYKLTRLPPTPIETLEKARETALSVGLKYVTIGNVPGHEANSTFCPQCGETVIKRVHFSILENNLENGKCKFCGYPIAGVWE
jgi:pyruvate formate lyase activating enzyme